MRNFSKVLWTISTLGELEFSISVRSKARASHFLGIDKEAKNTELFVDYEANGIPGSGIAEWNYRNIKNPQIWKLYITSIDDIDYTLMICIFTHEIDIMPFCNCKEQINDVVHHAKQRHRADQFCVKRLQGF